jgi:hypothetical protein
VIELGLCSCQPAPGADGRDTPIVADLDPPDGIAREERSDGGQIRGRAAGSERRNKGSDGASPFAGLIMDASGTLYCTTFTGGRSHPGRRATPRLGCGTVFQLAPLATGQTVWTETVVHDFHGYPDDRWNPLAGLSMDARGAFYGTTSNLEGDSGTVFKLTPPAPGGTEWTETVLHLFGGDSDGVYAQAGVIMRERRPLRHDSWAAPPIGARSSRSCCSRREAAERLCGE